MDAETAQSQRLYQKVAASYEDIFERAILAEGLLTSLVRQHMNGRRVLDLGCGNGRWLDRFKPAHYVGLDISDDMLAQARMRYPQASFVSADMRQLPFGDGEFDGVMSLFGAMGHLRPEGQAQAVAEAYRVLSSGGTAIFTNGNLWSPFNMPRILTGNRFRLMGVWVRVHLATPRSMRALMRPFRVLHLLSYDYSFLPIAPVKLGAALAGRDHREAYGAWMDLLDNCRFIPYVRWFGKQLVAVCRKEG